MTSLYRKSALLLLTCLLLSACAPDAAPVTTDSVLTEGNTGSSTETVTPDMPDIVNPDDSSYNAKSEDSKIELRLAVVSDPLFIAAAHIASEFNSQSDQYRIIIEDYSDSGEYEPDAAKMRLNVDIGTGNCPDMICFSDLSPYPFISHGYLLDMLELVERDPDISIDDFSIPKALTNEGGLYFFSRVFGVMTCCGLYSEFGDSYGWTMDEYLEIESSRGGAETIYNMTPQNYIDEIVSRYVSESIDWENGTCDLDNKNFISLLEDGSRINNNPEPTDPELMDFTRGSVRVAQGTLVVSVAYVNNVSKLAFEESVAGEKLSFVGWPSVDGSCGSDIYLNSPVGIYSHTQHAEGCWEFMKYMLTSYSAEQSNLPVYKPSLMEAIDLAKREAPKQSMGEGVQITDEDAERLIDLLANADHIAINDEAVMSIVTEEAMAYFDGKQTVEKAAELIQSRVRLYVSEQS